MKVFAYSYRPFDEGPVFRTASATLQIPFDLSLIHICKRSGRVISVEKSNVLDCSRLWKKVMAQVAEQYPDCLLYTSILHAAELPLLAVPAAVLNELRVLRNGACQHQHQSRCV